MKGRALICLIALLSLALGASFLIRAKRNAPAPDAARLLSVRIEPGTKDETIEPWAQDGRHLLVFLPSYAEMDEVFLEAAGTERIRIDGKRVSGEMNCGAFAPDVEHDLKIGFFTSLKLRFIRSENIPAMFIRTESGDMESVHADKSHKENAEIVLYDADGSIDYQNDMSDRIRGRGQWSWEQEKKPYNLYLEEPADLLELGQTDRWTLLANALDETNLRNRLVYAFAGRVGRYEGFSQNCEFVDLYLNGSYSGLYLLSTKVEISEDRLDLDEEDFLFDLDDEQRMESLDAPFLLDPGIAVEITEPDPCGEAQQKLLKDRLLEMQSAFLEGTDVLRTQDPEPFSAGTAAGPEHAPATDGLAGFGTVSYGAGAGNKKTWSDYIDLDSWARKYLIEEIFVNFDAGAQSQYFFWDRKTDRIFAGPCWDYDNVLGVDGYGMTPECFLARRVWKNSRQYTPWYAALWEKEAFSEYVKKLYREEFLPELRSVEGQFIPEEAERIRAAANADRLRWPDVCKNMDSYDAAVAFMTDFLSRRIAFLNAAWIDGEEYRTVTLKTMNGEYRFFCVKPGAVCDELPTPEAFGLPKESLWRREDTGEVFDPESPITEDIDLFAY